MAENNVLASAAASASYNMVMQLVFRLLTFLLNACILRYICKDILGVVNVRLVLLHSTTLFLVREAVRRACMTKNIARNWAQVVNMVWCTVPLCICCVSNLGYIWSNWLEQPDPDIVPYYHDGVFLYGLSAVLEMLAEPLWVIGQCHLFVRLKVLIEGGALVLRCIVTVILVLKFPHMAVVCFALAQIIYTLVYNAMYYAYFTYYVRSNLGAKDFPLKSVRDFFPKFIPRKAFISTDLASLTWSFFKQSFLKQILTEGERYVMTVFDVLSFGDQGVYDAIHNLGSLAARFIFLPIEESGYLFFSQMLMRGSPAKEQKPASLQLATQVLQALLKVVGLIGLVILVFGYAYSYLLLDLYGGKVLSAGTGPMLLRWYCVYVLAIAINGITECFVFAAMSKDDVDRYNKKMLLFSVLFLVSSWYLTKQLGSVGFILANCLNMAARIIHSLYYISKYYRGSGGNPVYSLLPSPAVIVTFVIAFFVTFISERWLCCDKGLLWRCVHVGIGAVCFLTVLVVVYIAEQKIIMFIVQQYRDRHKDTASTKRD